MISMTISDSGLARDALEPNAIRPLHDSPLKDRLRAARSCFWCFPAVVVRKLTLCRVERLLCQVVTRIAKTASFFGCGRLRRNAKDATD